MSATDRYLIEVQTGCWIWIGAVDRYGYGRIHHGKHAHRVFYEQRVGPIPDGLQLDHLCRATLCVNPDHLEPVTAAENQRRRYAIQTHCHRGHSLLDEANVRRRGAFRVCRACDVIRHAACRARREAAA